MPFKETETLELKKSTSELKEALMDISAMLNKHRRGEVIFGIEDNGNVVGQDIGKTTIKDISRSINDHIEPKIFPAINEEQIEGKPCIRVAVGGNNVPYSAFGRAHMRVGDKSPVLSQKELVALILKNSKHEMRWDDKACPNATIADIDEEKVRAFIKKANLNFTSVEADLRKLGLVLPDNSLTNAAVLLFGKSPQTFIRNAELRCAVFAGTGSDTIIDRQDYQGDFFLIVEEAQKYTRRNTHLGMRVEGLRRIDVPEIDPEALREAVVNAFCHRDYHNPDTVHVAVYEDRVEIRSPGRLYGDLTIAKIRKGGLSERRNELLADMLHRIDLIERWGRGIPLILKKEPKTTFKEIGRQFFTVFKRKNYVPEKVPRNIVDKSQENPKKIPRKSQEILEIITANPFITRVEIAKKLGETPDTVQSQLRKLIKEGLLKHVGPTKSGKWEITGKA